MFAPPFFIPQIFIIILSCTVISFCCKSMNPLLLRILWQYRDVKMYYSELSIAILMSICWGGGDWNNTVWGRQFNMPRFISHHHPSMFLNPLIIVSIYTRTFNVYDSYSSDYLILFYLDSNEMNLSSLASLQSLSVLQSFILESCQCICRVERTYTVHHPQPRS